VKKRFRTINQKFSSYLAGLFEGDFCLKLQSKGGCFLIPINERDKMNKIIYPHLLVISQMHKRITLTFNYKDFPLISIIQENLDIGQIYKVKCKKAYTYRISNLVNLLKFINIIKVILEPPKFIN